MAGKTPPNEPGKAPFVSQGDRPEVRIKSTTRISDLTVRDLATVLGQLGTRKDFWDGKDWQKDDFDGPKPWKEEKEFKDKEKEKEKEHKDKEKEHKEKREIKEVKLEKLESDGVFEADSRLDPRMDQVVRAISGLSAQVSQLADQLEALKKGKG
jgi:hypothetical protein